MSKKRVLFVTTVSSTVRAFLFPIADYFTDRGWQVDVMSSDVASMPELLAHFKQLWCVNFSRNPLKLKNIFVAPRQIIKIVKDNNYDILHVHSPVAAFLCRYALQFIPRPQRPKIVYTPHGFHFHRQGYRIFNTLYYLLEKIAGRWTDRLITINIEDYIIAREKKIVPRARLTYMPGIGIDMSYYAKDQVSVEEISRFRDSLNIKPDEHIFLMIAEFSKQKRQRLAIEAFAELGATNARLVLVGTGKHFDELKMLVAKKKLTDKIHLLGFQKEIPVMICASLATMLISKREGLPRAVLESLSLEKPVIGSDARGIKELLRKGGGVIIHKTDKRHLIAAMREMLDNPEQTGAMVTSKIRNRLKKHSLEHILIQHEKLYNQLIK